MSNAQGSAEACQICRRGAISARWRIAPKRSGRPPGFLPRSRRAPYRTLRRRPAPVSRRCRLFSRRCWGSRSTGGNRRPRLAGWPGKVPRRSTGNRGNGRCQPFPGQPQPRKRWRRNGIARRLSTPILPVRRAGRARALPRTVWRLCLFAHLARPSPAGLTRGSMFMGRRVNPRIKSGDGDDVDHSVALCPCAGRIAAAPRG